jgi:hypothetical protein
MPRWKILSRPKKEKEQFFVKHYVEYGATPDKIASLEKRCGLKPGDGEKIIAQPELQEKIKKHMAPVPLARQLQKLSSNAVQAFIKQNGHPPQTLEEINQVMAAARDRLLCVTNWDVG